MFTGPHLVTDGLVLALDAANPLSYPGSGTTWRDLSGNGKNGTFGGFDSSPSFIYTNGGSILFDGINDVVNFGTGNTFFPLPQFTIDIWFKSGGTVSVTGIRPGLFGFTFGLRAVLYSTYLGFSVDNGTDLNETFTLGTIPFMSGEWFNVVFYHTGTELGIYVNGILNRSVSRTWSGTSRWPTNSWHLGRDNNNSDQFFKGEIPICRMYNRVLTAAEILQNYDATKTRFGL
jgi:hypothetical protein